MNYGVQVECSSPTESLFKRKYQLKKEQVRQLKEELTQNIQAKPQHHFRLENLEKF